MENMIIGIDGNEANVEKRVGIGEYAYELLKQFKEFRIQNSEFRIYLKEKPRDDLPQESERWQYKVFGPTKLWTQFALPLNLYLSRPRPDVFFSPTHYAPRFCPVPTVISIMDLSYIHYPEMFRSSDLYQLKNWTSYSVRKAKRILTISKASKNDIIKQYRFSDDKVVVVYPGVKQFSIFNSQFSMKSQISNFQKIKEKYGISGNYILFVGTLQPRKNILRLIEAFSKIVKHPRGVRAVANHLGGGRMDSPEVKLVIVGKRGWLYEDILKAPKKFAIEDKVKFLDFVSDQDLQLLYQNAICFVLPSLYEGFGLPILEAMKYGCPVITSSVSSLPEAGGDAAIYVNPMDVDDIAKNLEFIIQNSELREKLRKKGYEQVKKFSWEKTARETLKVLMKVASNGKSY